MGIKWLKPDKRDNAIEKYVSLLGSTSRIFDISVISL